jgi:hypothetical protein
LLSATAYSIYSQLLSVYKSSLHPQPEDAPCCADKRKLHNDELLSLYSSPNIVRVIKSRRMKWARHLARMGEGKVVSGILVGRPKGKRPLGRPWSRWEDNTKLDLREIWIDGANWILLAQDRDQQRAFVKTVMNLRVP